MNLSTLIPQDRVRALARGETLPDRAHGSVLFADISGFTPLTEALRVSLGARRGAEELTKQLDTVYSALIAQIENFGGSVIGFAGDAITCWFDADTVEKNSSPARAVACAFALQRVMDEFKEIALPNGTTIALTLKVTVASGPARRFVVGDPNIRYLDTLAGATVARTATAEHLSQRGQVLIDEATQRALEQTVRVTEWRQDDESHERFAVVEPLATDSPALSIPLAPDSPLTDTLTLRPFIHHTLYERAVAEQDSFLTEFRPCAVLFVRFIGIDYDTDDAEKQLDAFIRQMQDIAARHEGALINIIIGDKGSYAHLNFGALTTHEDDTRRAVKTALALRSTSTLALQMGIAYGTLRVGAYGGHTRKTFDALGDEVNLAARLMTSATVGEILVSGAVQKNISALFSLEPRAPLSVKGKAEPLPVFAVTGERKQRAIRLQEPTYALPMVGRENELERVNEKLELALQGHAQVIGIVAEAGMGKSRLIAEIIRAARKKGFVGYGGACQADGIHTPYLAWKNIWAAFFDVDPEMSLKKQLRLLEGELEERTPERVNALPLLSIVLDLEIPENDFTKALEPKFRKSILSALLQDCLRAASRDEPLLIVLEDTHWMDALSRDLLTDLAKTLTDCRLCFVFAARPPDSTQPSALAFEALPNATVIALHELNRAEATQAIRAKLAQLYPARANAIPSVLVERLMARAQGNPFYLEELLNYLRDRGLDPLNPADLEKIELPDSLHTLVLSRLDQLSERAKSALRVASIIGRLFRVAWLTGYYPALGALPQVKNDLNQLERLDITPLDSPEPELAYLFKHIVTHQVTYESLPFALRAQLHEQLARYLEAQVTTGALNELPLLETLAFHNERGENWSAAVRWLKRAGELAFANSALVEAAELYRRALSALAHLPPQNDVEFELRFALARAQMMLGIDRNNIRAEFERALKLTTEPRQQAQVYLYLGQLLHIYTSSDLATAEEYYNTALALCPQGEADPLYCRVLAYLGYLYRYQQRTALAIETLQRALTLAQQITARDTQADIYNFLSGAYLDAGQQEKALEASLQGLALAEQIGNLELIGRSHSFCLDVYMSRAFSGQGTIDEALPHITEMRRHGREYGIAVLDGFGIEGLAVYYTFKGNRAAALECWRESAGIWLRAAAPTRAAYAHSKCGELLLALGDTVAAEKMFELVKQDCGSTQTPRAEFYIGLAHAGAGFDELACTHLQIAFDPTTPPNLRRGWFNLLYNDPEFISARALPGVAALLAQVETSIR